MQSAQDYRQTPIHVLVGENSRIHSNLLAEALKRDHRLLIVGSASSSHEFFESAALQTPDVVIINALFDDDPLGGMATLREFHEGYPTTPAVILLDSPRRE